MWPVSFGAMHSSLAVPPLLATFYLVMGGLITVADHKSVSDPATQAALLRACSPSFVALSFAALALLLQLSAYLYSQGYEYSQILALLSCAATANYLVFDGTRQGLMLAFVCGVGAPAAELALLQIWPLWHYSRPDLFGFVSWVPACYFFYTPALTNLARYLAWGGTEVQGTAETRPPGRT